MNIHVLHLRNPAWVSRLEKYKKILLTPNFELYCIHVLFVERACKLNIYITEKCSCCEKTV